MVYLPYVRLARGGVPGGGGVKISASDDDARHDELGGGGGRNNVVLGAHAIRAQQCQQLSPFAVVFIDKLSVQYLGVNNHGHDDGVVLADSPASMRRAVY